MTLDLVKEIFSALPDCKELQSGLIWVFRKGSC